MLSVMNLYLDDRHDVVALCAETLSVWASYESGGERAREDSVGEVGRAARKAPDAATTSSTLERDVIQLESRLAREPTRTGAKSGADC